MSQTQNHSSNGIGLSGAIFIVFLVLKLTGHIDWSWWWVTAPLWIPFGILILAAIIFVIVAWRTGSTVRFKSRGGRVIWKRSYDRP